ncbi:MAG TPA: DNA-formamidopyrimidine glycosylase, partial [Metalysinibacillus jejuensis]|nr:DNA-formamidopyrimidine glycosylase [Metalysinibacillus jejuensis]
MPELPEVEGVVRELRPIIEGKTIQSVAVSEIVKTSHEAGKQSIIKGSQPSYFAEQLIGMTITRVERRAKYIF